LLCVGGVIAGQTSVHDVTTASVLSGYPSPRSAAIPFLHDVGVWTRDPAPDVYISLGDTFYPRCIVQNFGSQVQTNIPVICVVYDTAAGASAYGPETVYVASLDSGGVDTVEFPIWVPPLDEKVYLDTMATVLAGDERPENDRKPGRITVLNWGSGRLNYHDGTFENSFSWVQAGSEFAERFIAPERPSEIGRVVLWLTSLSGTDYDAEVRVYASDGTPHGYPGTQLGAWVGQLHTDVLPFFYRNEVRLDPPVVVAYDTFFVSYYQTSIDPAYPWLGVDETAPIELGNDWGRYVPEDTWGTFHDSVLDFGIDVYFGPVGLAAERAPGGRTSLVITPNPVARFATVRYSMPKAGFVTLDVYDVTGRTVLAQTLTAGRTGTATLDLRKLKAGVYIVKVTTEGFSTTQKLVHER
jgi:hypothetical protein